MSEQKKGWFQRLTDGLSRSSRQLSEQVVSGLVKGHNGAGVQCCPAVDLAPAIGGKALQAL